MAKRVFITHGWEGGSFPADKDSETINLLSDFHAEIEKIKSGDEKIGKMKDKKYEFECRLELEEIDPNDLTLEDARMWYQLKNIILGSKPITQKFVESVKENTEEKGSHTMNVEKDKGKPCYKSRAAFLGLLRQIISPFWLEKQQEEFIANEVK